MHGSCTTGSDCHLEMNRPFASLNLGRVVPLVALVYLVGF